MKRKLFILQLIVLLIILAGCSGTDQPSWKKVSEWTGSQSTESQSFGLKSNVNRISYKVNQGDKSLNATITNMGGDTIKMISISTVQVEDTWVLDLPPGKYKLNIETEGREYEFILEELR